MASLYNKQACECGHGKSIHHPTGIRSGAKVSCVCGFPGCKCREYKAAKVYPVRLVGRH